MTRIFVSPSQIQDGSVEITEQAHHLSHVLRMKEGEKLTVCDGQGTDYECVISALANGKGPLVCRIVSSRPSESEPAVAITLFQSVVKSERMDLLLQKGTETGICEFAPFQSARSVVHYESDQGKSKLPRWQKIVSSAAEQSGRGRIPAVRPVVSFHDVLGRLKSFDAVLICYEEDRHVSLKKTLRALGRQPTKMAILIGPEGGFEKEEVDAAVQEGAQIVGLGPRIFRTETAGAACAAMVLYEFGQME